MLCTYRDKSHTGVTPASQEQELGYQLQLPSRADLFVRLPGEVAGLPELLYGHLFSWYHLTRTGIASSSEYRWVHPTSFLSFSALTAYRLSCPGLSGTNRIKLSGRPTAFRIALATSMLRRSHAAPML